jgi:hypothetical protein
MSLTGERPNGPRSYGGWRRSRGMGLFGLGPGATIAVLAALTVGIITVSLSAATLLVVGPVCAAVIAATVLQWDGVTLGQALLQRARWLAGGHRASFHGGVMATHRHPWSLPGVLAPTVLLSVADRHGGAYGVVFNRRLRTMTVTLRCAAQSTWLADPAQAAAWVANWGGWLAGLGHQPTARWVTVTVDAAPASGSRLADYVTARLAPDGPPAARRILAQLVATSPAAAAEVSTTVSITLDPYASPSRPRGLADALAEVDRTLPGLAGGLGACGVSVLGPATAGELAGMVRGGYDPTSRGDLALLLAPGTSAELADDLLGWDNAGPVAATEHRDRYQHDGATSVTWAWHEAPRQPVAHDVLARLVTPGDWPKRVSLLYRPLPAARAARVVEDQVNAATFRDHLRRARKLDPRARDVADHEQALQAAREEALGAGVGFVSVFVTVTVLDEADLGKAVADVEARAQTAKVRLRRLWSSQAAGFAVSLPCGLYPPVLARVWPH